MWFDVERRYKTIQTEFDKQMTWLWFDVERRYKTIDKVVDVESDSCGLM